MGYEIKISVKKEEPTHTWTYDELLRPYFQSFVIIENDFKDLIASTGTAVLDMLDDTDYRFVFHSFFTKQFSSFCEQR
ncbi:MAG: hypothetical protein V1944_01685, partial [Candidatus Aenigmatarchaeota archaeon]